MENINSERKKEQINPGAQRRKKNIALTQGFFVLPQKQDFDLEGWLFYTGSGDVEFKQIGCIKYFSSGSP